MKNKCMILSGVFIFLLLVVFLVGILICFNSSNIQKNDAIEMHDILNSLNENSTKVKEKDFSFLGDNVNVYDISGSLLKGDREYKSVTEMQITENKLGNSLFFLEDNKLYVVLEQENSLYNVYNAAILSIMFLLAVSLIILLSLYFIKYLINPFIDLERFASEVARGNLDFPLSLKKQNVFGAFTVSFDLMRKELKHSKEREIMLKKKNFELLSSLTHDIKTPLQTISAITSVMETKSEINKQDLELINSKVNQISSLLNDIQDSIGKELTTIDVQLKEVYLKEIVEDLILPFTRVYNNIKINDYPNLLLKIDKTRVLEVIQNLVSNSLKYNKEGIIEFSFSRNEEFLIINVFDGGNNLKEEDYEKIFDKFFRGSNSIEESGNGLGLYIVKNILEKHNGFVELNMKKGFSIDLGFPLV